MTTHDPIKIRYADEDIEIVLEISQLKEENYLKFGNEKFRQEYFNKLSQIITEIKSIV